MVKNIMATLVIVTILALAVSSAEANSVWSLKRAIQTEAHQLTIDSADDVDVHVHGILEMVGYDAILRAKACREEVCIDVYERYTIVENTATRQWAEMFDQHGTQYTAHILDRTLNSEEALNVMLVDPAWGTTTTYSFHLIKGNTGGEMFLHTDGVMMMEALSTLTGEN